MIGPFTMTLPEKWIVRPSTKVAELMIPGAAGQDAVLVVEYFGTNGAGGASWDVTDRWVAPYLGDDGKPSVDYSAAKDTYAGQVARTVSVEGRVAGQRDQALMGAVIESPRGPYYFKLTGPGPTITANHDSWWAMLHSLRLEH